MLHSVLGDSPPPPVLGTEDDDGNFLVQDCGMCSAGIAPPPPAPQLTGQLLFVSGLRLGAHGSDACANLLLEWLAGFCGSDSGSISACVLLGNGCAFRWVALLPPASLALHLRSLLNQWSIAFVCS